MNNRFSVDLSESIAAEIDSGSSKVIEFSAVSSVSIPLETLQCNTETLRFNGYDHRFKLALSYPLSEEFADSEELREKIAEFNTVVLKPDSAAIMYQVDTVLVGTYEQSYILGFTGTTASEYLEVRTDEIVQLLTVALEGYFLCIKKGELKPVYFEVDGQVVFAPTVATEGVPVGFNGGDFWRFLGDAIFWDPYVVSDLAEALGYVVEGLLDQDLPAFDLPDVGGDAPDVDLSFDVHPVVAAEAGTAIASEHGATVIDGLGEAVAGAVESVGDVAGEVASAIGDGAEGLAEGVGAMLEGAREVVGAVFEALGELFSGF
jgi:hypothetical protein